MHTQNRTKGYHDDFEKKTDHDTVAPWRQVGTCNLNLSKSTACFKLKKKKKKKSFIGFKHNPESDNVILKKSRIDSKMTQHTKNHENFNSQRKRESTDTDANMIQMLKLCEETLRQLSYKYINDQSWTFLKQMLK